MRFLPAIAIVLLCCPWASARAEALAPALNQSEAQSAAEAARAIASDKSLQLSTTRAMQAMLLFGENELPAAVKSAYKAYGSFKLSEGLDLERRQSLLRKAQLGSGGTLNLTESEIEFLASPTSYRRLDGDFLRQGESARIAEEFEKKTGIQRQDFLKLMAAASEKRIFDNDPKLPEKVDSEFAAQVAKIPDPAFRGRVETALNLIPVIARYRLLSKAVESTLQLAFGSSGDGPPPGQSPGEAPGLRAPAAAGDGEGAGATGPPAPPGPEEALDWVSKNLVNDPIARFTGKPLKEPQVASVVTDAIHFDAEGESIFQRVSKKYRALSPALAR